MSEGRRAAVELRRVYEDVLAGGPPRVLVDRLWPRGIAKVDAPFDDWLQDVAPSTELRRWYAHDPAKFERFAARYRAELGQSPAAEGLDRLRALAGTDGVILVTATRDVAHSAAEVLLGVLLDPDDPDDPDDRDGPDGPNRSSPSPTPRRH